MSSEGKAKRGASGQSNAQMIPFRYGNPPHHSGVTRAARNSAPSRVGNSTLAMGMVGGLLAQALGFKLPDMTEPFATRCNQAFDLSPTVRRWWG